MMSVDYKALVKNADMMVENGNIPEALELYEKAIEEYPYDDELWIKKGNMLATMKRYEEALEAYDTALYINPNREKAWHAKGLALHFLKRYDEAIECFDKAIEIHPDYDTTWHAKGVALFLMGRYEEALRHFEKALEIYPLHKNALKLKQQCIEKLKEMGRSEEDIDSIARREIKILAQRKAGGVAASVMTEEAKHIKDDLEKKIVIEEESEEERERRLEAEKLIIETQNLVSYLEKIGLALNDPREMLIEAVASFEGKEYDDALEFAAKARKIAEEAREQHRKAVDIIADVWNSVREVMEIGGECPETETLLDTARDNIKMGNYDRALNYAVRAKDTVERETENVLKEIAQRKLIRIKSELEDLKNFYPDGDYRDIEKTMVGVDATILEGRLKRAMELISTLEGRLEEERFRARRRVINQNLNTAQQLLLEAQDYISRYGQMSDYDYEKEFQRPNELLSQAREAYQEERWDEAYSRSIEAKESARSLKRFVENNVATALRDEVKRVISVMQRDGMTISDEVVDKVKRIEKAMEDKVYVHAVELANILLKELRDMQKEEYRGRARGEIERMERIVATAEKAGIDLRNLDGVLKDLKDRYREGDYGGILMKVEDSRNVIDEVKNAAMFKLAEDEIIRIQELITDTEALGIDISSAKEHFKKAQVEYLNKNYTQVIALLEQADEIIKIRRSRYDKTLETINTIKSKLQECRELGAEKIELERVDALVYDAQDALLKKDMSTAESKAAEAREEVSALEERLKKRKALEMITKAPASIKELNDMGDPAEGLKSLLDEAKLSFEKGNSIEAYDIAKRVLDLASERRHDIIEARLKNRMDYIRSLLSESREQGVDVRAAEEEFDRAADLFLKGNYEECEMVLAPMEEMINRQRMKGLISTATEKLMSVTRRLSAMKNNGLPVKDAETLLQRAKNDIAMERYSRAIEELKDVDSVLDLISRRNAALQENLKEVETLASEIGDDNRINSLIKTAREGLENGDYDLAEAMLEKAHSTINTINLERRTARVGDMFNSLIEGHKRLESYGYESPEIYAIIREAEDAKGDLDRFEELVRKGTEILAQREAEVLTKLALDSMSTLSMEIESRKSKGVPVGKAPVILEDAKRAAELGNYEKSVELCHQAENELKKQDEMLLRDTLEERIRRAEANIETLTSMGKSVNEAIMNLLVKAREGLEVGDYSGAEESINKVFASLADELSTLERQKALDRLMEAQMVISEAAEAFVDTKKAEERLEAARNLYADEDFEGAENLASEAIALIKGEASVTAESTSLPEETHESAQETAPPVIGHADRDKAELHIKLAEASIQEAADAGIDTSVETKGIENARKMMENGEYEASIAITRDIRSRLESSIHSYRDFMQEIKKDIMPKIYALRSRGMDVSTVEAMIKEAEASARRLDMRAASRTMENVVEMISALEEGDMRSIASEEINKLQQDIDIARHNAPDSPDIARTEDLLKKAKEMQVEGDYEAVKYIVREARDIVSSLLHDSDGKKAQELLLKVQDAISEAKSVGGQTIEAENLFAKAREAYRTENYPRVMELCASALDTLKNVTKGREKDMADDALMKLKELLADNRENELVATILEDAISRAESLISEGRYMEVPPIVAETEAKISEAQRKSVEASVSDIIERVREQEKKYREEKILSRSDMRDVEVLLEKAEKLIDIDGSEALTSAMNAERKLETIVKEKLMKEVEDTLISAQGVITEAKGFGVTVEKAEELFAQAKEHFKAGELMEALEKAREAKKNALETRRNCEDTLEIIKELNDDILELEAKGVDVTDVKEALNEAKEYIKKDMYEISLEKAEKAKGLMSRKMEAHGKVVDMLSYLQTKWVTLKKKKVPTDALDEKMGEVSTLMKKGDYEAAASLVKELSARADEMEMHYNEYSGLLNEVKMKIADLKRSGAAVDAPGSRAKKAIELAEAGDFSQALEELMTAKEELIKIEEEFLEAKKTVDLLRQKLVEARTKGRNVSPVESRFSNIIKLMNSGSYPEAKKEATETMKQLLAMELQGMID